MQNLDKVALGGAAIVILGSILYALFGIGGAGGATDKIQSHDTNIDQKISAQQSELKPETPEPVSARVRESFSGFDPRASFPDWSFYRRPGIAIVEQPEVTVAPKHEGPRLIRVAPRRDSEQRKVVIDLTVEGPKVEHAKVEEFFWEYDNGSGWERGGDLRPDPSEQTTTADLGFPPGSSWKFRLTSRAKSESKQPFTPQQATRRSEESTETVIPFDFSFRIQNIIDWQLGAAGMNDAEVLVEYQWYDYDDDTIKTKRGEARVPHTPSARGAPEREVLKDKGVETGFYIRDIDADKRTVSLARMGERSVELVVSTDPHRQLEPQPVQVQLPRAEAQPEEEPDAGDGEPEETPDEPKKDKTDADSIFGDPK